ncbi:MAG: cyclic nucleotide-regulated FAD-dependent pyridine nucleotide-disulfide oxidoreductase [Gemmatimonadetes bacterium]|nr:cyclic nucleotide-regulated FAD-dependent pyridine nucleotide-disulfide oxidoreductase [Gemmatimonadota bacterium]
MPSDATIAFPTLDARQIDALRPRGTVRRTEAGEVLWRAGDRRFPLFVVLAGAIEVVEHAANGEIRPIAHHSAGQFTGDVDMLTGRGALIEGQVSEAGEVLAVESSELRRVLSDAPELGETLLRAFLMRRTLLLDNGFEGIKIIGSRFTPATHALAEFCSRNAVPYTLLDLERDPQADDLLRAMGVPAAETPVVLCRDGRFHKNPTIGELAAVLGLVQPMDPGELYDLVVVGAGPAGLAAAVYAASEGLRTLTVDATAVGGQAGTSSRIENYLGFPTGISGQDLAMRAMVQAEKFGADFSVPCTAVGLRIQGGDRIVRLDDGVELRARAVIVASGIEYRRLSVPRVRELEGAGVYYSATEMEARLAGGEDVVVVGGGNSAGQAAVFLARHSRRVHLVIRGDELAKSMSRYLIDRLDGLPNVTLHRRAVVATLEGEGALSGVTIQSVKGGAEERIAARALFIFIGAVPHTGWLKDCVALDARGFVLTGTGLTPAMLDSDAWRVANRPPLFLETSLPGVFAAGDARAGSVKRVASAVGEGSMAISFVHAHLGVTT